MSIPPAISVFSQYVRDNDTPSWGLLGSDPHIKDVLFAPSSPHQHPPSHTPCKIPSLVLAFTFEMVVLHPAVIVSVPYILGCFSLNSLRYVLW